MASHDGETSNIDSVKDEDERATAMDFAVGLRDFLGPSAPPPDWLDGEFLDRIFRLTEQDVRKIAERWLKQPFRHASFSWIERPFAESFADDMAEGMAYPAFVHLFCKLVPESARKKRRWPIPKHLLDVFVPCVMDDRRIDACNHLPFIHPRMIDIALDNGLPNIDAIELLVASVFTIGETGTQPIGDLEADYASVCGRIVSTRAADLLAYVRRLLAPLLAIADGRDISPFGICQTLQKALSGNGDLTKILQSMAIEQDLGASERASRDVWVELLREPCAELPRFADAAWFASAVQFDPASLKRIHEMRGWLRDVAGLDWPENRPGEAEAAELWREGMKRPIFAFLAQRKFFGVLDGAKGFPKASLRRRWNDAAQRIGLDPSDYPCSPSVPMVSEFLRLGGDEQVGLAALMQIPGWDPAACGEAVDGLDDLEAKGGERAEVARYLRALYEPIGPADTDLTAYDILTHIAEPRALLLARMPGADPEGGSEHAAGDPEENDEDTTEVDAMTGTIDTAAEDATGMSGGDTPAAAAGSDYEGVLKSWSERSDEMAALAAQAKETGPDEAVLLKLRSALEALTSLRERAELLAPRNVGTAEFLLRIEALIGQVEAALAGLVGDVPETAEIRSSLAQVSPEVDASALQRAEDSERQARGFFGESERVASEIAEIDRTLPIRAAREKTGPLLDERETLLRRSLQFANASLLALIAGAPSVSRPLPPPTRAHASEPQDSEAELPAPVPAEGPSGEPVAEVVSEPALVREPASVAAEGAVIQEAEPEEEYDRSAPVLDTPPAPAGPEQELLRDDPIQQQIIDCLDRLVSIGEMGLAYHLLVAAEAIVGPGNLDYHPLEFRLAAAAGRASGLSGQELQLLDEARSEAITVAQSLEERSDSRSIARRILLLAGALPTALFRTDDLSAIGLVEHIGGRGFTSAYFQLVSAIEDNRKRGFPLTPASLAAAEANANGDKFLKDSVAAIKATIEGFRAARFRFVLGEKIKHAMNLPDGVLGRLMRQIDTDPHKIAREVAEELKDRNAIIDLLASITDEVGKGQEIDGPARERVVGILSQLGQQCRELAESLDANQQLRHAAGRLETVQRLRDTVQAGIETVLKETQSETGDPLVDAANAYARKILAGLQAACEGRGQEKEMPPLAVALHGPLLWLPGFTWTGGWIPSPNEPERVLQAITDIHVPLLGDDPAKSVEAAFEARRAEGAFVPATMLLNIARWHGMPEQTIEALLAKLEADKETKKAQVRARLQKADRLIDRMRRMAVGSLEQSARLKEALGTVNPDRLPVDLPPDFLPESVSGDRVEDFNSAFARIDAVEREAIREFEKVTASFRTRIDALCGKGLDRDTCGQLVSLLDRFEFTTLADWLNILESGEGRKPLLPSGPLNKRLESFRACLPSLAGLDLLKVAEALEDGGAVGPITYGLLDKERREERARVVRRLLDLKRMANKNTHAQMASVQAVVTDVVSGLFYEVDLKDDPVLTRVRQQIYVYDAKVALPQTDPTSLILPEFGSMTQGAWRIAVVQSTVSTSELIGISEGAAPRGVAVFILGVLNEDKRTQLRKELYKRKRPMLVFDEALIAVAMADTEDRRRALVEIAQGYSAADPFRDHGRSAVPREMFKGRVRERNEIEDPAGSHIVFGGRRLGKTALLQHIHATQPPNAVYAFCDLDAVMSSSDAFEQISKKMGKPVMAAPVSTGAEFSDAVVNWLAGDERRRILLMVDEADNFVRMEAESGFRTVQTMLQLQAQSHNRFKLVLAGLHNVSRLSRAENSPLVHLSTVSPLRIGPLVDRDVDDAEFLVRGPLAAMGYEFDSREDVWRILSFTNYYPVLIQVFCQELLRLINEQVQQGGNLPKSIGSALVEKALGSSDVRSKLYGTFEKTISSIEGRYELITYILAVRELMERDSGMAAEGLTPAEVAERAMECWPAAFPKGSDPVELEYLLEEMEGFGIARRVSANRFALRSRSLLELMAVSEAELHAKLARFKNERAPAKPFDPKNYRRKMGKPIAKVASEGRYSPLTDGQESDLLSPEGGVAVIFGSATAGIQFVESALLDTRRARDGIVKIEVRSFLTKKDLLADAKRIAKADGRRVLVVASTSAWHPDWVVEAERLDRVRDGRLRIIFVGDAKHARTWAGDGTVRKRSLPQIKVIKLRPWTRSFLGGQIDTLQLGNDLVDKMLSATGGWNEIAGPLMQKIAGRPRDAATAIAEAAEAQPAASDLGIPAEWIDFFKDLASYADGTTISTSDFQSLCSWEGRDLDPKTVGLYGDLLGIFSYPFDEGEEHGHRHVEINPLALRALVA